MNIIIDKLVSKKIEKLAITRGGIGGADGSHPLSFALAKDNRF
jgi:hypothetical protein